MKFKHLIVAILIGLLAYPPFAFAGGAFDSKTFPGLEPDTYDSCFFYWNQGDARMYGDGSEQIDGSGYGNNTEQGTGAKQPGEYATYLDFDGTDDYMSQAVIASHTGLTPADSRCSFAAGASWLAWDGEDFSAYASDEYEVVLTDSAGKRKKGVLSATVGGGETWGSNLYTSDFSVNDDGFTDTRCTVVANQDAISDGAISKDDCLNNYADATADTNHMVYKDIGALAKGERIRISQSIYVPAGQTVVDGFYFYLDIGGDKLASVDAETVANEWIDYTTYTVAPEDDATTLAVYFHQDGSNYTSITGQNDPADDRYYLHNIVVDKMTDCSPQGVHVVWGTEETGFDPNDITGIEIRKAAFSVTGDMTWAIVVKPDDGQPAADEVTFGKMDETNNFMGYGLTLDTAGKLVVTASNDGAVNDNFITDAAVFADGTQATGKFIVFVYNASESNIDIFVDGAEVASTEAGDVSTAIYDTCCAFNVARSADGNYAAQSVKMLTGIARAISAAEVNNMYLSKIVQDMLGGL